jgi:hypothetical protein
VSCAIFSPADPTKTMVMENVRFDAALLTDGSIASGEQVRDGQTIHLDQIRDHYVTDCEFDLLCPPSLWSVLKWWWRSRSIRADISRAEPGRKP